MCRQPALAAGAMKPHETSRRLGCRNSSSWVLLILLASSALLPPPALATRQGRQSSRIAAAAAATAQDSSSNLDSWPRRRVHSPFNSEASMQIAARQRLFDYAVTEALAILGVAVEKVKIPEYRTTLEIPVIGGIDVTISNVNITDLQVRRAAAGSVLQPWLRMPVGKGCTAASMSSAVWQTNALCVSASRPP